VIYGVLLSLGLLAAFLLGKWYGRDTGYLEGRNAERKSVPWGPSSEQETVWRMMYATLGTDTLELVHVVADQASRIRGMQRRLTGKIDCWKHGQVVMVPRCPQCELEKANPSR